VPRIESIGSDTRMTCTVSPRPPVRRVRICYFNSWADALEPIDAYLARLQSLDLKSRVAPPQSPELLRKARLDCEWYGENARCFLAMRGPGLEFHHPCVCGPTGLLTFAQSKRPENEELWLITMAHQPQSLSPIGAKVFAILRQGGVHILYYAFDEASRFMPCFREVAPHLDVLIHDEAPLDPVGAAALRPDCARVHRSWVANFVPFSVPFNSAPERKILFLGSQLGLTDHRKRQIDFLKKRFKDLFVASTDHTVGMADRGTLNRYKVGLCPEGRKFRTPAMSETHTDRPFWSGVLGLVPVSENSKAGNRLDSLAAQNLIVRYEHGDLEGLAAACERALEMPNDDRHRIYEHFNRSETIGTVVADGLARFYSRSQARP